MQSGSNTEMSPFYYGGTTFSECFRDFWIPLRTIILCMIIWMTLTMRTTMMIMMRRKKDFFPEIVDLTAEEIETMFEHVLESFRKKYPEE